MRTETIPITAVSSIVRHIADIAVNPATVSERGLESVICINLQGIDTILVSFLPPPSVATLIKSDPLASEGLP